MDQFFGMKEIYQVVLRATEKGVRIGNRILAPYEPVTYFEHIQIASLSETIVPVAARGGRRNDPLVIWEDRKDVTFRMQAGVLSDIGFGLLTNARIEPQPQKLIIGASEKLTLDDDGRCAINNHQALADQPLFCFLYDNKVIQQKITPLSVDYEMGIFEFGEQYAGRDVMIDYRFQYGGESSIYILERERFTGMFELEGKIYRKGEEDGINRTTLFRMPQVRIISNLNVTLGEIANPTVSTFNIVASPKKTAYSDYTVVEMFNLNEDIS